MRDKNDSSSTLLGRPWLFPAAYLLHIVEETRGVGVPNGFKLTMTQFFVYSGAAWALMVVGVWLGRRHGFSQFMQLCLGSGFLVNGFTPLFQGASGCETGAWLRARSSSSRSARWRSARCGARWGGAGTSSASAWGC